jgi:eukaryotic-like serine/threonine-protein kinase
MSLKLGPRYRVLGPVASGGMGEVLLAISRRNDEARPVALKQLHAHLADDARMVDMFVDEARIASRLSHPNIVRVNDVEMIGDDVVLVMDFVEGIPLSALLRKLRDDQRPMPLPIACRIVHDVLLGLHAAHEATDDKGVSLGVIHRDVSPQNILLGADGIARIADFGVAKARGRLANTQADGTVKGKLQYLSPEQIYRRPVDRRADVFSAGIIFWECLAGKKLFSADTEGETLARVITGDITPPSAERFDVPLDLDEVCLRALERKVERRYPTAEDFARALEGSALATQEELAALVAEAGAETIAEHRALLASARGARALSPGVADDTNNGVARSVELERPVGGAETKRRSLLLVALALALGAIGGGLFTRAGERAPETASSAASAPPATAPSTTSAPSPSATAELPPIPPERPSTPPTASETRLVTAAPTLPAVTPTTKPSGRPIGPRPRGRAGRAAADGGAAPRFEPDDL